MANRFWIWFASMFSPLTLKYIADMPDLVPVVFFDALSFFSLFRQKKKDFLLRHRSPSSKDSASGPDPQYLRRTHGMHRHRIQTSHKGCHPPPRSVPVVPENDKSGRILVYIQTLIGLFIKHQPGWQDSKRMRDQKLIIIKKQFPEPAPIWWNNPTELPFQNPCPVSRPWY